MKNQNQSAGGTSSFFDPTKNLRPIERKETDYGKLVNSGPLQVNQRMETETNDRYSPEERNKERREERIKRENLLNYYDAELKHAERELRIVTAELSELENKVRNEEKEVNILVAEERDLKLKLALVVKRLRRFQFELRVHKGEQMEKRIVKRRWEDTLKEAEAKVKKIKYGDWKSIRK